MEFTHLDPKGNAVMVDVSEKSATQREAIATGKISMKKETLEMIGQGAHPKGDVLAAARIAGIMAAKRTYEIIPLCHPLPLDSIKIELTCDERECCVQVKSIVRCTWKTGVEMEALTGVSAACLTIYDMCKAVDKEMVIGDILLRKKTGGKSGDFIRKDD